MKAAIFPVLADALDVRRVEGELDLVLVLRELFVGGVDQPEHLLRLETRGVVLLGHEQAEEHRVEAALFRAHQIELAVVDALAHVAAVVELAIDDVDVGVEDERVPMERVRAIGDLGRTAAPAAARNQRTSPSSEACEPSMRALVAQSPTTSSRAAIAAAPDTARPGAASRSRFCPSSRDVRQLSRMPLTSSVRSTG